MDFERTICTIVTVGIRTVGQTPKLKRGIFITTILVYQSALHSIPCEISRFHCNVYYPQVQIMRIPARCLTKTFIRIDLEVSLKSRFVSPNPLGKESNATCARKGKPSMAAYCLINGRRESCRAFASAEILKLLPEGRSVGRF